MKLILKKNPAYFHFSKELFTNQHYCHYYYHYKKMTTRHILRNAFLCSVFNYTFLYRINTSGVKNRLLF